MCPAPAGRWWPQALCPRRLTGFGIHHCFARSMMGHEVKVPLLENFYADYYTAAGIALASCLAVCPAVRVLGRRGGLLLFMILTALASLLQLGLLNREWARRPGRAGAGPGVPERHPRALGAWAARGVLPLREGRAFTGTRAWGPPSSRPTPRPPGALTVLLDVMTPLGARLSRCDPSHEKERRTFSSCEVKGEINTF